jgi:predicted RNA-binding protein YlxR (DUF448 family)
MTVATMQGSASSVPGGHAGETVAGVLHAGPVGSGAEPVRSDDPGPDEDRASPVRRCIASGESRPRDAMVRFVVAPDGSVVPDIEETLPGRGLWLTADREMAEKAVARNAFSRAARRSVRAGPETLELTRQRLLRRCLDTIGLARRGGLAVSGFEKVATALRQGRIGSGRDGSGARVGLWLEASDGAADGRAKLQGLADGVPQVQLFDRSQLGAAFGRDDVVHAVLGGGALADRLMRDVGRLAGLGLPAGQGK